jgi:hypothetical protein
LLDHSSFPKEVGFLTFISRDDSISKITRSRHVVESLAKVLPSPIDSLNRDEAGQTLRNASAWEGECGLAAKERNAARLQSKKLFRSAELIPPESRLKSFQCAGQFRARVQVT